MGAKFSSGGGATVFYDDGPITAPSGEQGTQRTEFEAAIKSVTSSTTVGAVFVYDTRNDSDGGAWRKKARGSWYSETLNTATRGGRREFPSVALIVADNVSSAGSVTIYDLDDPAMPMYMVFNRSGTIGSSSNILSGDANVTCVHALNGRLLLGQDDTSGRGGLRVVSLVDDSTALHRAAQTYDRYNGDISQRNAGITFGKDSSVGVIANQVVNDVAATVLEGAEIGALGLPIPTIAVATANKISVIHSNGTVANLADTSGTRVFQNVTWRDDGSVVGYNSSNGAYQTFRIGSIYADTNSNDFRYENGSTTNIPNPISSAVSTGIAYGNGKLYGGNSAGLTIFNENKGNPTESLFAYITSTYNSGMMLGDIRLATLANSTVDDSTGATMHDRSVKGNNLTEQGSVHQAAVATNAELKYYTNFGSSNYLSRGYSGNFNFTNTMSVMFWVKDYEQSKDIYGLGTRNSTLSQSIYIDGGYDYRFTLTSNGTTEQQFEIPEDGVLSEWTFICFSVNAGAVRGYKNGQNVAASNGTFTGNIFSQATDNEGLEIGKGAIASAGSSSGKLALFRISATAPTPQQVKEIYEAERPLFRSGAKCLLQHSTIHALDYDKSTDLLSVGQTAASGNEGVTKFRGLENVAQFTGSDYASWSGDSIKKISTAGGVSVYGRTDSTGGVIVDLPPVDVRGDINTADTKLPDDGKLHFSGVTTNATPTVIGQIPVANNEHITVSAQVCSKVYNFDSVNSYYEKLVASFQKKPDGTFALSSGFSNPTQSVSDTSGLASVDVEIVHSSSAGTVQIKVTGNASYRMQWNATVEVQRISEKQYER